MVIKRLVSFGSALLLTLTSLFVFSVPRAFAATITWTGGAADNNLATAGNWSSGVAPATGDVLDIPLSVILPAACPADISFNNNIVTAGVTLGGVDFSGSRGSGCVHTLSITGNELKVSGDVTATNRGVVTLNVPVTATTNSNIQNVAVSGLVATGSNTLTVTDSNFTAGVSGTGKIVFKSLGGGSGPGCTGPLGVSGPIAGNSSGFSGTLQVNSSTLTVSSNSNDVARHASAITVDSNGSLGFQLDNNQDMSFATPLTFEGGLVNINQVDDGICTTGLSVNKTLTLTGNITANQASNWNLFFANVKITGALTGKENIKLNDGLNTSLSLTLPDGTVLKSALKTIIVDDTNKATYCNSVNGFFFPVDNNNKFVIKTDCTGTAPSPINVDGILAGTGKVNNVNVKTDGRIAPGTSPGCLSVGDLVVSGNHDQEIGGTTACSGYDQLNVTGTVNVTNGTLNTTLVNGFKPAVGQTYNIIDNDTADAVTGTFANLPEGATFSVSGYVFKISYVGGSGNDVVLTVQSVPAAPNTGFALLKSNPIVTLVSTFLAAGSILVIAKRYQKVTGRNS